MIQNFVYQELRQQFGLSANQTVRVCARVGAKRKTEKIHGKPVKVFSPASANYDARIFAFTEKDWKVSLTLLDGREHIKLNAGNYQRGKLKGRVPTSAQLCKHRDGQYYVHIKLKNQAPEPIDSTQVIGVDFGRRDIAVTSIGDKWTANRFKALETNLLWSEHHSHKKHRKAQSLLAAGQDRFCNGPRVRSDVTKLG